jgi:isopentenyl diphosphate isomerase/L-lactate dehydrogenase-like FMN-dependent dehydrogenase
VVNLLKLFQQEIAIAMALMGVNRIAEITPELIDTTRGDVP